MEQVKFQDLGTISYKKAWDYQEELFKAIVDAKIYNKKHLESNLRPTTHHLLFCEHPPVFTLGKSGQKSNLLINEAQMESLGIEYYKINRGGDITFHGPEQIVGYPILDLEKFFTDIHRYMRTLEEMIILTLKEYGLEAGRLKGATGVWLDPGNVFKARKICAMGVRCSRWTTMHGWAFNVNTRLDYFNHIVPCGIDDKAVTSMEKELGQPVDISEVKLKLKKHFASLFECELMHENVTA